MPCLLSQVSEKSKITNGYRFCFGLLSVDKSLSTGLFCGNEAEAIFAVFLIHAGSSETTFFDASNCAKNLTIWSFFMGHLYSVN